MNPLPNNNTQSSQTRTTIVVGGGSGIPFHQHPPTALTAPVGDAQLPDRLGTVAPKTFDANSMLDSGWWSAHIDTAAMPFAAQWVGLTIRSGADTVTGNFLMQIAFEVDGSRRIYRRTLQVLTWSAWAEVLTTEQVESYQVVQSGAVTPNGTANSTLSGLSQAITSPGTSAVYMVRIKADVQFAGAQTNIIELLVDGVAETAQIVTQAAATGYRFPAPGEWRVTGLAAGTRTFTARTRNTAAGTNVTVNPTHTLMTVQRVA